MPARGDADRVDVAHGEERANATRGAKRGWLYRVDEGLDAASGCRFAKASNAFNTLPVSPKLAKNALSRSFFFWFVGALS